MGVPGHAKQVICVARGKIIDDDDGVPLPQQPFNEMRADEARAAGNKDVWGVQWLGALFVADALLSVGAVMSGIETFSIKAVATASASFWR